MAAVRIMALPRDRWMANMLDTVEPRLQALVRLHINNALWRKKWAG